MAKVTMGLSAFALISVSLSAQSTFTRSVRDGTYTSEQAERGKALYAQYCATCHMPDLAGRIDPTANPRGFPPGLTAPALRGREFIANWANLSLGDLFERNRVSMPQDNPGSLSRRQNADVLAFMLQQNGYAIGPDELPMDASLKSIKFEP